MLNKRMIVMISILFSLTFIMTSYGDAMAETKRSYDKMEDVPESAWKTLSEKKIYFGHQSVGFNIIGGINDIIKENKKIRLKIVKTRNKSDFSGPLFAHSTIGANMNPKSKIDDFADILKKGVGEKVDYSAMKLCYIDFNVKTDVERLFERYKQSVSDVKKQFPNMTYVHFTVPLTSKQTGAKAWIKKMMGKPLRGFEDNVPRNRFNELIIAEFGGKDPIFDLAKAESIYPNGKRSSFTLNGKTYYAMVDDYTDDGAHLNKTGSRKIAVELLLFLVNNLN